MATIIGSLTVILGLDSSQATSAIKTWESKTTASLAKVNSSLQRFGYVASTALTLPIVMAGRASFQLAKDFEYSMQKIVGLTGVAQASVNSWNKDILEMGPRLAKSPQELADALYFISSSGIKGAEAMNVLELSAKAATAGLGDTKTVADLLTSALNAYAGTGLTAQYATDTLVAAVREGKAEASGFATSMGQIIPIAAQLGVSFDQVAGGMAAITLTGASSANAAVYLKGVFNSLLTASTKGEKALNAVGTSYAELRDILGSQGLIPLMQRLRDIQMQYGDEIISDVLPNIRSLTGFLSLAGKNFKYNSELIERVTNSSGSLGKAFAAVADTIKVRYDRAIAGANVAMISLGKTVADTFLPMLENIVKKLSDLVAWFNGLTDAQKKHKIQMLAFLAILGPASLALSALVWILRGAITIISGVARSFIFLGQSILGAAGSTAAFNASMATTAKFPAMLTNPWIVVGLAIAGATKGLYEYIKAYKEVHAIGFDPFAEQKTQIKQPMADVQSIASDSVFGNSALESRMKQMHDMNLQQLETLKNDVATRIQLENDLNLKLKAVAASMPDDPFTTKRKEQISTYRKLIDTELNKGAASDKKLINAWNNNIDYINNQLAEYQNKNLGQLQISIGETSNAIKKYTEDLATLSTEIKTIVGPMEIKAAWEGQQKAKQEEINKIFADLADGERYIGRMTNLLGKEFDTAKEKTKLYSNILEDLAKTDIPTTDKRMRQLADAVKLVNDQIVKVPKESFNPLHKRLTQRTIRSTITGTRQDIIPMKPIQTSDTLATIDSVTNGLIRQEEAVTVLARAFEELFTNGKDGFKAMFDQFLKGLNKIAAELVAKVVIWKFLDIISIGGAGTLFDFILNSFGVKKRQNFATGGVVPGGYPNDTYPALLSSGETVLPKRLSGMAMQGSMQFEPVELIIKENSLVGILKKATTRKSLY